MNISKRTMSKLHSSPEIENLLYPLTILDVPVKALNGLCFAHFFRNWIIKNIVLP